MSLVHIKSQDMLKRKNDIKERRWGGRDKCRKERQLWEKSREKKKDKEQGGGREGERERGPQVTLRSTVFICSDMCVA